MMILNPHIPPATNLEIPDIARVNLPLRLIPVYARDRPHFNCIARQRGVFCACYEAPLPIDIPGGSEYTLPSITSLIVVLAGNTLFQFSYFIIIPSAISYVKYLGGTSTFAGFVIGVPVVLSGISLIFVKDIGGGQYRLPFVIAYISALIGNVIYALAYTYNFLYLTLIGRMIIGISLTSFIFSRKYCTDPKLVGIRRRTVVTSWYALGQVFGFSAGPWVGGLLYKLGFSNPVFNGYTAPSWIVAGVWLAFCFASGWFFEDAPNTVTRAEQPAADLDENPMDFLSLPTPQKCLLICVCYYCAAYFFILSGWESNIPVFTAHTLGYSPYEAGNIIAIGGAATFPFIFINARYGYRIRDCIVLIGGTFTGVVGLLLLLVILINNAVTFWSIVVAWFLVALGFNLASTSALTVISKQMPGSWTTKASMAIQYSNYVGRMLGAVAGAAGVKIGMERYVGIQIAVVGFGMVLHRALWTELKIKTS